MDEGEAMFSARFNDFEMHTNDRDAGSRRRNVATKKVSDAYHIKRAKREKEEELKRVEREMKQQQTDELKRQFERLAQESA